MHERSLIHSCKELLSRSKRKPRGNQLLTRGVASKGVLSTETGRQCTLLEGVHEGVGRSEEGLQDNPHTTDQLGQQKSLGSVIQGRWSLSGGVAGRQVILGELFAVGAIIVRVLGLNCR